MSAVKVTHRIEIELDLAGEIEDQDDTRIAIAAQLGEVIQEDYGTNAWGGYEGPKVSRLFIESERARK